MVPFFWLFLLCKRWSTITAAVKRMIKKDLDPGNLEVTERELEEIYEKQVKGLLDRRVVNLTNQ